MSRRWTFFVTLALGGVLLQPPAAGAQESMFNDPNGVLGAANSDLVFTPVTPCRIIDTRIEGGRLVPGTPRDYDVAGALGGQGGAPNCAVPEGPSTAVVLNFVAVGPGGAGNLRAWPFGQAVPIASVINYTTGVSIANGVVIGICDQGAGSCAKDFTVRADASDIHLVVDVMGYFSRPPAPLVPWSQVTGKPTGFADDVDNDTQYSGGPGITVTGTVITPDFALVQRRVVPICSVGSAIRSIDATGAVICEPDDNTVISILPGLLLNTGVLSVDQTVYQRRVTTTCPAGQSIRAIDVLGVVTCEPDDNTTYSGTNGIVVSGTSISADTNFLQRRTVGTCPTNSAIRVIDAAGNLTCEPDSDTTYSAGFGLTLVGSTFSVDTADIPRVLAGRELSPTLCNSESIVLFTPDFAVTPSVTVTPQGLAATAIPPNTYCVVDEVTTSDFHYCCFGSLPDSVSWIAVAPTQ